MELYSSYTYEYYSFSGQVLVHSSANSKISYINHHLFPHDIIQSQFSSVIQSCPTLGDPMGCSTRLPCPSPTPRPCSNSCPSSGICHPTISSTVVPAALNLSQHQGLFQWVSTLQQVAKVLELQWQHQSFQWTFRTDLLQDELVGSPCSLRDSQESSPTPQFKSITSLVLSILYGPALTSTHDYWENHSFD